MRPEASDQQALTAPDTSASTARPRMRKVALEEHFILPGFIDYLAETKANIRSELVRHGCSGPAGLR